MPSIDVIIPVYNAFDEAYACLTSVLKHSSDIRHIFVVDDFSSRGSFESFCRSAGLAEPEVRSSDLTEPHIRWQRSSSNNGFVASCNWGINESSDGDVILLNSDTIVTRNWVSKLKRAGASAKNIGTVTPFTNNGSIASIPYLGRDNCIPEQLTIDEFAALVERVSPHSQISVDDRTKTTGNYTEIPTCVGFCVLIKRHLLQAVGVLDEKAFPRGYGEENDLSLRGQAAGFIDIADDATFIFHKGTSSFGAEKTERLRQSSATLRGRYPHYERAVARFVHRDDLAPARRRITAALETLRRSKQKAAVLHVLHNGPVHDITGTRGGTERHVELLTTIVEDFFHWSVVPHARSYILSSHGTGWSHQRYFPKTDQALREILLSFDSVHLHQPSGFDYQKLGEVLLACPTLDISMHDYYAVTPQFQIVLPRDASEWKKKAIELTQSGDPAAQARYQTSRALFAKAHKTIFFSKASKEIVDGILFSSPSPKNKPQSYSYEVVKHPAPVERAFPLAVPSFSDQQPLKACFLGTLAAHKGEKLARELSAVSVLPSGVSITWHLLGGRSGPAIPHITEHGPYERPEVVQKLQAINPDIVLFLSNWPETYGLTVDESLAAGIPVLAAPFGGPAERLTEWRAGVVLENLSLAAVITALDRFSTEPLLRVNLKEAITNCPLPSVAEAKAFYSSLYAGGSTAFSSECSQQKIFDSDAKMQALILQSSPVLPLPSLKRQIAKAVIESALQVLDTLRVRYLLQQVVKNVLSQSSYEKLRSTRRAG